MDRTEQLALRFFLFTHVAFAAMIALGVLSGGAGAQELYETYQRPAVYAAFIGDAGPVLRLVLFFDFLFMIGYGGGIGLTAAVHAARAPVMAWVAGIGIAVVVALDLAENLMMLVSIDLVRSGEMLSAARIAWQAGLSGAKWVLAAMSVVALTVVLPRDTFWEKLLVWLAPVVVPVGVGLFVTGAFNQRGLGTVMLLTGMGGGFALLALTAWHRLNRE